MKSTWQPTATIDVLRQRAAIMQKIRAFFEARQVLEVETPQLSQHTITDPYLEALVTTHTNPNARATRTLYLQTSPEYAMKRLLAAGSGDIFQLCKAYRDDEVGKLHNPEFTMLEWYRIGFDMQKLIEEVIALLKQILNISRVEQRTYTSLFQQYCGLDPLLSDLDDIIEVCEKVGLRDYVKSCQASYIKSENDNSHTRALLKDSLLQVLFSQEIEVNIAQEYPLIVTHFPASQASLATLNLQEGDECYGTANRFEAYFKGIELANGFHELTDYQAQKGRFEADNEKRLAIGLPIKPIDEHFLASLAYGLPQCAGVALGVDRLIMLTLNKSNIQDVISFAYHNC